VTRARRAADEALEQIRSEIHAARELLARETLTEARLDETMRILEERAAAQLPAHDGDAHRTERGTRTAERRPDFRPGQRVRTAAGWQGRLAEIDEASGQATLEAGAMRVVVPVAELELVPAGAGPSRSGPDPLTAAPSPSPRAVAATLDVRGARVDEAVEMVERYVDQASVAGAPRVTIIHGHGSGALRDAIRGLLSGHSLVRTWRPGERGEGGAGATVVEF
jgi:DNA mismatch repair protein MutS2